MLVVVLIAIVVLFVICTTPAAFLSIFYDEAKTQVPFTTQNLIDHKLILKKWAFITLNRSRGRSIHSVFDPYFFQAVWFTVFRAAANNLELLGFALNFFVYCLCSADIRR